MEYEKGVISWNNAKRWRFWFRKEWIWGYVGLAVLAAIVIVMSVLHHKIIHWLMPIVERVRHIKYGFFIPVAIIFLLCFPPLFGNEIIIVIVGLVWGLWVGLAITAAGVVLGESAVFFMFRHCLRGRAERMTKKDLNYACLSQAIVEGGFLMAWVVRLSIIPTHFTTAVFAVCGLDFVHFFAALVLGLPKQLIAVYLGVVLAQNKANTSSRVVNNIVLVVTILITLMVLRFVYRRMISVRKKVLLSMRDDLRHKGVSGAAPVDSSRAEQDSDQR